MNKRDYLRSLGFEVGERGRFSAEMMDALKSFKESDTPPPSRPTPKPQVRQRDCRSYILELEDGIKVGMASCYKCKQHVVWCSCAGGPQPPTYFDSPVKSWYPEGSKEGALC